MAHSQLWPNFVLLGNMQLTHTPSSLQAVCPVHQREPHCVFASSSLLHLQLLPPGGAALVVAAAAVLAACAFCSPQQRLHQQYRLLLLLQLHLCSWAAVAWAWRGAWEPLKVFQPYPA